jgi:hypothetical protein
VLTLLSGKFIDWKEPSAFVGEYIGWAPEPLRIFQKTEQSEIVLVQEMKACRGSGGITPLIFKLRSKMEVRR